MPDYQKSPGVPPKPVAVVNISNPATGEAVAAVPMLLDSGADMSVLPLFVTKRLNLQVTKQYQICDFNGNTHVLSAFHAAIQLEGRKYIGVYLAQDDMSGIVGRDLLNEFRLILDGPKLVWEISH